jgi:hypothetical protein
MSDQITLKLTTAQARPFAKAAFPQYKGRKFKLVFTPTVTFYDTNWSGGTRSQYVAIASDGRTALLHVPAPWVNQVEGKTVPLPEDAVIVEHTIFCGQDAGLRIYVNPVHLPKWLPAPKES